MLNQHFKSGEKLVEGAAHVPLAVGGVNEDVIQYASCHKLETMNNLVQGTLK